MSPLTLGTPAKYKIAVKGYLNSSWSDHFGDMTVSSEIAADGTVLTVLTGRLVDQAALFGVLDGLYGLGFPLVLVQCLDVTQPG